MDLHFLHPLSSLGIKEVTLSGIRVERLEERLNPKVPFPHKHDFYQLMVMTAGSGSHQIDFVRHKVTARSVFLMKPGQVHNWDLNKKPKGILVEFNRDVFVNLSGGLDPIMARLHGAPDAMVAKTSELQDLALSMLEEFQQLKEDSELVLSHLLIVFVVKILRAQHSTGVSVFRNDDRAITFKRLVEENFRREHRVEFYAKKMASTPKALTMQMGRLLGKAPRTIIQERVVLEAKRLLAFSELSVADIGFELGFEDANYFTRFFRQHESLSPATFRKTKRS